MSQLSHRAGPGYNVGGSSGSSGPRTTSAIAAPLTVINNSARIEVESADPVIIMEGRVEVLESCELKISGVIAGTFNYVCGIAVYIDDVPISLGTGRNKCHPDCMTVTYEEGGNSHLVLMSFLTATDFLSVGKHTIKVGVISRWDGTTRKMYVNNRDGNDMASSSSLVVEAGPVAPPFIVAPLAVINKDAIITIDSDNPVVIMQGEVEVQRPCKLKITGVIAGSFNDICGIAVYIDDVAINLGTGTNNCHADCMTIYHEAGGSDYTVLQPLLAVTDLLSVGTHTVKVGVISKWNGVKKVMYVNNRANNDMPSSSSFVAQVVDAVEVGQSPIVAPLSVIFDRGRFAVSSNDPVVIMEGEVEILDDCRLKITGSITGTFEHACGIAIYIDDVPINQGTGTNNCHVDCMIVHYENGSGNHSVSLPVFTVTDLLSAGTHTIKLGVIGKWNGVKKTIRINNRVANDMPSSSSLTVEALTRPSRNTNSVTGKAIDGEVNTFADLAAIVNPKLDDIYWVTARTVVSGTTHKKGLYKYNDTTWDYLGDGVMTINENDMNSNSSTLVPVQSSVKTFVENETKKTFEYYSENLMGWASNINYTDDKLTSITYSTYVGGYKHITKTPTYATDGSITKVVLTGNNSFTTLNKNITSSNGYITSITYTTG